MERDVVIVGAGIMGLSTAYHVKRSAPGLRVLVVDMLGGPGQGDTARSAAAYRTFFRSRTNRALARGTVEFYRALQDGGVDLGMRDVGYLFLLSAEEYGKVSPLLADVGQPYRVYGREEVEAMLGARTRLAGDEEAELMGLPDIEVGLYVPEAGIIDPEKVVRFYYGEAAAMGVEFVFGARATGLLVEPGRPLGVPGEPFPWQDARVGGVVLGDRAVRAGTTVVAAGAWTEALLDGAGVAVPVKPKKRQVFAVRASTGPLRGLLRAGGFNRHGIMPMTILPRRLYVRPVPEEEAFWVGVNDDLGRPYRLEDPPTAEERYWAYGVYPPLSKYLPQFEGASPASSWAGHYDVMFVDGQPVVDRLAEGLVVVAGSSGSGIMKADALGRLAAAAVLGAERAMLFTGEELDVDALSLRTRKVEPETLVI